eukprot:scaffold10260_cov266-Chaetoceros_neogracile.AAC.20
MRSAKEAAFDGRHLIRGFTDIFGVIGLLVFGARNVLLVIGVDVFGVLIAAGSRTGSKVEERERMGGKCASTTTNAK